MALSVGWISSWDLDLNDGQIFWIQARMRHGEDLAMAMNGDGRRRRQCLMAWDGDEKAVDDDDDVRCGVGLVV